ncbi:MAG: glycosyltransferase family 39 protein [Acidobacteriia bacterium]|nr:glycosyltransferase family 39 protein [Terriglobia bacterium]
MKLRVPADKLPRMDSPALAPNPGQGLRRYLTSPAVIFVLAFAIRLAYLAYVQWIRPGRIVTHIVPGYETGQIARSLAEGRGFSSPLNVESGPTAWITPVYPYILAGIFKVFGIYARSTEIVIKILNCLLAALACFPLYALGRRLFSPGVGAAAAWCWALNSTSLFFCAVWTWDTSLSALLLTLLLWATYALDDTDRPSRWTGYGGLWAFGALTNAAVLSVFPGLLGYATYRARQRGASWLRLGVLALVVFAAGVSPWLIRNQVVFHKALLFRSPFGLVLWLGNNPEVPDTWSWWLHPTENAQEREKFVRMGEIAYMQEKQSLAMQFIKTHPADFGRFVFRRFMYNWTGTWEPLADIWKGIPLSLKISLAGGYLFSLLALLGLFLVQRAQPLQSIPLLCLLLLFPLVYYITQTSPRYRHPIDPAMGLLAVLAVAYPLRTLRGKRRLPAGKVDPLAELAPRR